MGQIWIENNHYILTCACNWEFNAQQRCITNHCVEPPKHITVWAEVFADFAVQGSSAKLKPRENVNIYHFLMLLYRADKQNREFNNPWICQGCKKPWKYLYAKILAFIVYKCGSKTCAAKYIW